VRLAGIDTTPRILSTLGCPTLVSCHRLGNKFPRPLTRVLSINHPGVAEYVTLAGGSDRGLGMRIGLDSLLTWLPQPPDVTPVDASAVRVPVCVRVRVRVFSYPGEPLLGPPKMYGPTGRGFPHAQCRFAPEATIPMVSVTWADVFYICSS